MSLEGLYNERADDTGRDSKIRVNPDKTSTRPIRAIGLLLILQTIWVGQNGRMSKTYETLLAATS